MKSVFERKDFIASEFAKADGRLDVYQWHTVLERIAERIAEDRLHFKNNNPVEISTLMMLWDLSEVIEQEIRQNQSSAF